MSQHQPKTFKSTFAKHLREQYRQRALRTTASGHKVYWDEPGEQDSSEVKSHNAHLNQQRHQKAAKERLKSKGLVPTRKGKPLFEKAPALQSTTAQYLRALRHLYETSRIQRFEQWVLEVLKAVESLP